MDQDDVVKALMVTAQLYGREFSPEAAALLVADLDGERPEAVLAALTRCRRELRTFPTVADIIERIDDGRPGPEEAFAMLPKSEADSTVWTREMSEAYGVSSQLQDRVAARLAFVETYRKLVAAARANRVPASWSATLGHDKARQANALKTAIEKGRLSAGEAENLLPDLSIQKGVRLLPAPPVDPEQAGKVKEFLSRIRLEIERSKAEPQEPQESFEDRRRKELREEAKKLRESEEQ